MTALQEIALSGRDPALAWQEAVSKIEGAVAQWRAQHPTWQPPECRSGVS
jgi:hypothetical protein